MILQGAALLYNATVPVMFWCCKHMLLLSDAPVNHLNKRDGKARRRSAHLFAVAEDDRLVA